MVAAISGFIKGKIDSFQPTYWIRRSNLTFWYSPLLLRAFGSLDQWQSGAKSYLGIGISNFPNLFTVTGPGSPSVLSNMLPSIEQHVNWITDCIQWMENNDKSVIESSQTAEDEWMILVNEIADTTIFTDTKSWYNGSNIDNKAKAFLPFIGVPVYTELLEQVVSEEYKGFIFDKVN